MTLLERVVVSRKTPADGRLMISAPSAARLASAGVAMAVEYAGRRAPARLVSIACSCGKGPAGEHVHHFVESPLLAELVPKEELNLMLDESGAQCAWSRSRDGSFLARPHAHAVRQVAGGMHHHDLAGLEPLHHLGGESRLVADAHRAPPRPSWAVAGAVPTKAAERSAVRRERCANELRSRGGVRRVIMEPPHQRRTPGSARRVSRGRALRPRHPPAPRRSPSAR